VAAPLFPIRGAGRGFRAGFPSCGLLRDHDPGEKAHDTLPGPQPPEWESMLLTYGIISAAATLVFIILVKERPPTPALSPGRGPLPVCDGAEEYGLRKKKNYIPLAI